MHGQTKKKDYSPGMMCPNFFAPAVTQRRAAPLMELSKVVGGVLLLRKTLAFLSFQTVQLGSIVRDPMAFMFAIEESDRFSHHSLTEVSKCQSSVLMFSRCSQYFIKF